MVALTLLYFRKGMYVTMRHYSNNVHNVQDVVGYQDSIGVRRPILIDNDSVNGRAESPAVLYSSKTVLVTPAHDKPVLRITSDWTLEPDVEHVPAVYADVKTPHLKEDLPFVSPVYVPQTEGSIELWLGASVVKVKRPPKHVLRVGAGASGADPKTKPNKRGRISGFSKAARWRMKLRVNKMKLPKGEAGLPSFVTLTYPGDDYSHNSKTWKRDLDTLFKRMKRKFPLSSAIWKLEPQKRGAPHFHLLVWGVNDDRVMADLHLMQWLPAVWHTIVGSSQAAHLVRGVLVKSVWSWGGIQSYLSKYMSKLPEGELSSDWEYPGRWWGVFSSANIPWGTCIKIPLPLAESKIMIRYLRKYAGIKGRDFSSSLTIICRNADDWFDKLPGLIYFASQGVA